MNKDIKNVVIKPDSYTKENKYPVIYLLHGHSDKYDAWVKKAPSVLQLADQHDVVIVCPDGGVNSWYWDSPINETYQYETFVAKELIEWIDANYSTVASREGRAVTGLSMGGHGGLYLGFRHQDVFGACGSMSGGVDIRPFPDNWGMKKYIGEQTENPDVWYNHTVMGLLHLVKPNKQKIIIDCGVDDFFYDVNKRLHNEFLYRNIPHDFISRPGGHTWEYWTNAIKYQVLFFNEFFNDAKN